MSPRPLQPELYARVKKLADATYGKPSAYKSGWIVKTYKSLGGKYAEAEDKDTNRSHALARWFLEDWVDLNRRRPDGTYEPCGRLRAAGGPYPLCRPSRRVSKQTPATVQELSRETVKRAQSQKRRAPVRRVRFQK